MTVKCHNVRQSHLLSIRISTNVIRDKTEDILQLTNQRTVFWHMICIDQSEARHMICIDQSEARHMICIDQWLAVRTSGLVKPNSTA